MQSLLHAETLLGFLFDPEVGDRLWNLVVRVPGNRSEMYCDSCEVRTEFIYVM
jgi:hypothetical protein